MAPRRQSRQSSIASKISNSSILDAFRKSEEPAARLAIKTRGGEHVIKLPSGTKVLIIHNSDADAEPHHVDIGEVTVMGPVREFIKWYCYAVLTAAVCLGLAGLLLFFLFPRPVEIEAPKDRLYPYYRHVTYDNSSDSVKNAVNVKYYWKFRVMNNNYIPITIEEINCKVQAFETLHRNYKNTSQVEIPLRSNFNLTADVEVFLSHNLGFMAKHCNDPRKLSHTIILNLDVTVRYQTMLGREGRIVTPLKQEASCGPKGPEETGGRTVKQEEWRMIMEGKGSTLEGERKEGDSQIEVGSEFQREKDIIDRTRIDGPVEGRPQGSPELSGLAEGKPQSSPELSGLAEGKPESTPELSGLADSKPGQSSPELGGLIEGRPRSSPELSGAAEGRDSSAAKQRSEVASTPAEGAAVESRDASNEESAESTTSGTRLQAESEEREEGDEERERERERGESEREARIGSLEGRPSRGIPTTMTTRRRKRMAA